MKYYLLICSCLFVLFSCSPNKQRETLFLQADSLVNSNPDSALHLLKALPGLQELSRKESARYALLLTRATDKAMKPLLPCDSLLNIALHYYDSGEKERAVALLYKGRLEDEMENREEAIKYLQEALAIVNDFPKETETRRLILSSLGNFYFDARYYEEAIKMYLEFYDYCRTDKDKSIALNGISSYYIMTNKGDSAIIIQKKALEYAMLSRDSSIISMTEHNLSIKFENLDSALFHAHNALKWAPKGKSRSNYIGNLGGLLLEKGENLDSAKYYLNESLKDSTNIAGKGSILTDLYELEKKQKNYEAAFAFIEEHVAIIDSFASIEASTEIQQLIHKYHTKIQLKKEQIKGKHRLWLITSGATFCFLMFTIFYQHQINKRERAHLIYQQNLKQTQKELASLETLIEENQSITTFLQKEYNNLITEKGNWITEFEERNNTIEKLKKEKVNLRNLLFSQTSIYKKIIALSKQDVSKKTDLKVLTTTELSNLKKTIFEIYDDYISNLRQKYSKLTDDDMLCLCLIEANLTTFTIALCFGTTNTHTINQRKSRIKERMKVENK